MIDLIEGLAIAFSLLLLFGLVTSFIFIMWAIGRKERLALEQIEQQSAAEESHDG